MKRFGCVVVYHSTHISEELRYEKKIMYSGVNYWPHSLNEIDCDATTEKIRFYWEKQHILKQCETV